MSAHLRARASRVTLGSSITQAARQALQPRLLLLWALGMAIPTLLFAMPVTWFLAGELNHSPAAPALASKFEMGALLDLLDARDMSVSLLFAAFVPPLIVMLIISPWLNALSFGAARIPVPAKFRALISSANASYWSMVRMGLFGLVPLTLAIMLARIPAMAVSHYDEHAVVASTVEHWTLVVQAFGLLLISLAQCSLEVGRAVLVAHPRRRSVVRAWWAGLGFLRRHPVYLFGVWLLITVPALLLVGLLMVLRTNLDQGSVLSLLIALLLAEACVLALAFMKSARLFSLVDLVARFTAHRHT